MATQLPDGTVVKHPPGKRAVVPKGNASSARVPNVAAGIPSKGSAVLPNQPGRKAVSTKER